MRLYLLPACILEICFDGALPTLETHKTCLLVVHPSLAMSTAPAIRHCTHTRFYLPLFSFLELATTWSPLPLECLFNPVRVAHHCQGLFWHTVDTIYNSFPYKLDIHSVKIQIIIIKNPYTELRIWVKSAGHYCRRPGFIISYLKKKRICIILSTRPGILKLLRICILSLNV